uniref:Ig-like domain-containing protein n=1 Tax=Acanthochromis polyacanthus TaxID=80966 RepID=A0A3Q1FM61_9TELE
FRLISVVLVLLSKFTHHLVSGSVLEVTARPGDNITLYCDCELSKRISIMWIRNCSHENQPSLVLKSINQNYIPPRFELVNNSSSNSYDLLIKNITNPDEGLYYCGTRELNIEEYKTSTYDYRYSNITTRIILSKCFGLNYLFVSLIIFTAKFNY